ncbi:MAG: metallophosphoesterase [Methylohalobius sp.]|nr:metallophosphoesterase [Methylohalobius sp.]
MPQTFCLAHLSDPHLTSLSSVHPYELLSKRILGYLSWQLHRRHEHRFEVLQALVHDLHTQQPDHIVVTGDLTQLGLPHEYRQATDWLAQLGPPEKVTVVPGNHDRYVAVPWQDSLGLWQAYLTSDHGGCFFPIVRKRGPVVLLGVDSAPPSAPFLATGKVGKEQLMRLSQLLAEFAHSCCRIVLIHHPPHPDAVQFRKRLTNHAALCDILAKQGCGLVLHGHSHKWQLHWLKGPTLPLPVIGVPSASAWGTERGSLARYHLYRIVPTEEGFNVDVEIRSLCQRTLHFYCQGFFQLKIAG